MMVWFCSSVSLARFRVKLNPTLLKRPSHSAFTGMEAIAIPGQLNRCNLKQRFLKKKISKAVSSVKSDYHHQSSVMTGVE